jgi:ABC-2 type transport system ATP-binding protein
LSAIDRLSFQVKADTATGFFGAERGGQDHHAADAAGLVRPDGGQARIWGNRYAGLGVWRRKVGVVLEASGFHPGRTVRDHLRVRCAAAGIAFSRADAVLEVTGLDGLARRRAGPRRWGSGSGWGWLP